jgi:hypothetical protein
LWRFGQVSSPCLLSLHDARRCSETRTGKRRRGQGQHTPLLHGDGHGRQDDPCLTPDFAAPGTAFKGHAVAREVVRGGRGGRERGGISHACKVDLLISSCMASNNSCCPVSACRNHEPCSRTVAKLLLPWQQHGSGTRLRRKRVKRRESVCGLRYKREPTTTLKKNGPIVAPPP